MLSFRPGLEYHNTVHMGPDNARPLHVCLLSTSDSSTFTVLMTQDVPIHCQISPYEKRFPVETHCARVRCCVVFVYCCVLFEECSSRWHLLDLPLSCSPRPSNACLSNLPMSYTEQQPLAAYLASLSTQGSCSLLLGCWLWLAVVGCGTPTANNSVCSCLRPARHLIPMGYPLQCSGGSLEGFPPRGQLRQNCPSLLAVCLSVQLSAKP